MDSTQACTHLPASQGCGCHPFHSHIASQGQANPSHPGSESGGTAFHLAEMTADRFITSAQSLTLCWVYSGLGGHWSALQGILILGKKDKSNIMYCTPEKSGKTMGSLDWSPQGTSGLMGSVKEG